MALGFRSWRSAAQKEAALIVASTPPGHTQTIVLPTGAGKSLCFHLLPRFSTGLTLVIVPTVSLAMDQQESASKALAGMDGVSPSYYSAGKGGDETLRRVKERRTRLLFTSPESCVSGKLRTTLDTFSREGWLQNLVVDEAHVIQTWGAEFRIEFQVLSAARQQWLSASNGSLRTFLFSATMTPDCRRLLDLLFGDSGKAHGFVCQRLRPEVAYWHQNLTSKEEQHQAVADIAWHLPRPAILYATEKEEAKLFLRILQDEGFRRIGCFHGETESDERRSLLRAWKANEIDLMVATSAFGLGVDKHDVRAVVHACLPENLDRFYQEVGRGGRDGWSSASLLLWTNHDHRVAESLSPRLMTPELAQERWDAMFQNATNIAGYRYRYWVPVNSRRVGLAGERTFRQNVNWNKRLLAQMQRANLLTMHGLRLSYEDVPTGEDFVELIEVEVRFPPNTPDLGGLLAPCREQELSGMRKGLSDLEALLKQEACVRQTLGTLYGMRPRQRVCGGCPWCRAQGTPPGACPELEAAQNHQPIPQGPKDIVQGCPSPSTQHQSDDFKDMIYRAISKKHIAQIFISGRETCAGSCKGEALRCRVLALTKEAMPPHARELYRIECACRSESVHGPGHRRAFIHVEAAKANLIENGGQATHFMCTKEHAQKDAEGRHIADRISGCRFWASLDHWMSEAEA